MSLFKELKRRNVFRVVVAYAVASWLLVQMADILIPMLRLPEWIGTATVYFLIIGFIPALIFAWAFEMTPEGIKKEREVQADDSITGVTGRKLDFTIIGLLAVAVIYLLSDKFSPATQEGISAPSAGVAAEPAAPAGEQEKSIAVLPFVNMSDDASNEYFSDGISEEILNALAKVKELKVAGRTSSFAFKGESQDLRRIGEALGVEHILEGSVRKAGNTVRITAQLIKVDDGFHMWSETYDRELTNIFAIQDEIAAAILAQLKAELLEEQNAALVSTRTDSEAYELYLLAKQRIYARNRVEIEAAAKMLDSALEIDPHYAPALAQRGIATLLLMIRNYGTLSAEKAEPISKDFLDRAIELDARLAEAWAGLGLYHTNRPREHRQAIEALEKALSINPNLINASNWLQIAYFNSGQGVKALQIMEDMLARDPLYKPGIGNAVFTYNSHGQQQKSLALLERTALYLPDDPALLAYQAITQLSLGNYAEGLPMLEESLRHRPDAGAIKFGLGAALLATHQYEKILADVMPPSIRIRALHILGRTEEASISAYERAATGAVIPLFRLLNRESRPADLVRYFEERWPDLDAFQADFPPPRFGYSVMIEVALAYSRTGNEERFNDAMARIRKAHDSKKEEGLLVAAFFRDEVSYYALAGDFDQAMTQLETALEKGAILTLRIVTELPATKALEGDPRFEALQAKMIGNLNSQRAALGLEPATI